MKILKLADYQLEPVTPTIFKNKRGEEFYNIVLGNRDIHGFRYSLRLSKTSFNPKIQPNLTLDKDDYILRPFIKINNPEETKISTDKQGNMIYILDRETGLNNPQDIILIWDIPNNMYNDIKFDCKGNVNILACGYNAKTRGNVTYKSPSVLLEVYGDCSLSWKGLDNNKTPIGQTVNYTQRSADWKIDWIKV